MGDVTLKTRIMLKKRAGRPKSCTSATRDRPIAALAPTFAVAASAGRPVRSAPAPSREAAPESPPRKR